jgi:mannose-1-phosphate guanylyltransferase/mannose-6-phosphate isomerase
MSKDLIHPIILCGGSGTRLWPKSRKAKPKPFLPLVGETTLFREACDRCDDAALFAAPMVVAGPQHVDLIAQQASDGVSVIVEPAARNTAPAIALAAAKLDPQAIMLVCPSDHHVADTMAFRQASQIAADLARKGSLVAFGITPDRPETGYGYIKQGKALGDGFVIERFVEKPDLARAEAFLAEGGYSWNGGIFVFRAGQLLDELSAHRPDMAEKVKASIAEGSSKGIEFHPAADHFKAIEGDSIDYAVMENTKAAAMVPVSMGWSDIGDWAALKAALECDAQGNHAPDNAELMDCMNVLAVSDGLRISAVGLEDLIIVVDGDDILVTRQGHTQKVGKLRGASEQ